MMAPSKCTIEPMQRISHTLALKRVHERIHKIHVSQSVPNSRLHEKPELRENWWSTVSWVSMKWPYYVEKFWRLRHQQLLQIYPVLCEVLSDFACGKFNRACSDWYFDGYFRKPGAPPRTVALEKCCFGSTLLDWHLNWYELAPALENNAMQSKISKTLCSGWYFDDYFRKPGAPPRLLALGNWCFCTTVLDWYIKWYELAPAVENTAKQSIISKI